MGKLSRRYVPGSQKSHPDAVLSTRLFVGSLWSFGSDEVVVDDVCGESDCSDTESGEHLAMIESAGRIDFRLCWTGVLLRYGRKPHPSRLRLEKIGCFRHASRAAHGSRYSGPGI